MTQLEIAAIAVGAFALFMFGYSLGWMQRGRLGRRDDARDTAWLPGERLERIAGDAAGEDHLEARFRRAS
ncbi:hypothetical protein [Bradyrhizobium quebecense]|uniref:Uncharacterized protein n=2 Tax=Bradyrhizobium quebecense TaxID=2748629 RepID=A0A939RJJ8_9BRAD|nr:hypothetical protein [Bradyrhizobium quebecense]UGA47122.1 hypothetical protein HU230_0014195 [Bradyrhizobium quebecense]UGY03244.1 hypothetical protein J4P68_0000230 [Bradyrhizobium quebecense]